ncbi:hypothetical protein BJ322DRAFT_1106242 [Thelephora terrestris]|uniref:CBS domain-containing protein n=1 Tax=Thelephora terrestris TaxID=56493 RepID=A0A9P6HJC9_9AGAM|nr:hypothetical protein BJ322DRAFT_1106242 [Thelephora terrestris]
MAHIRRASVSSTLSNRSVSPLVFVAASNTDTDEWVKAWKQVTAQDLVESPVVAIDADESVEVACDTLLSSGAPCLAIQAKDSSYLGLFDHADVNAFLVLAATRHKPTKREDPADPNRAEKIIAAATAGHVPVQLVSNLSDKNPLHALPHDADLVDLLALFAGGAHKVLVKSPAGLNEFLGVVTDRGALAWFASQAQKDSTFLRYLSNTLSSLPLPSLYLYSSVVAVTATSTVLDAMSLMSDEGVSSVAVTVEDDDRLLSAISVTDIAKIVVPSENSQVLSMPVHQLVTKIKEPDGATDGADKYPVYSVVPSNTLAYAIEKLLATNAHRLFVTDDNPNSQKAGNILEPLSGIVSTVDVLSLFAVAASIPNVDPARMKRHRRASSSTSSSSGRFGRSRSTSVNERRMSPSSGYNFERR